MGCSGNCYPLFLIAFNINPPIIAIGMETESETGSRNAPNIPPKIVQTTARAIISGLHNFQNIFSAAKSYVVQHGFVFDWIKISIAHLFGLEKRKEKGTADFRCSFCIYASKTISRVLYLTVIYLDVPLPVRSSHPGSGRASLGAEAPAPIPVLLRIEFTAMDALTHHRVSSYLAFPPLPPGLRLGGKPIPDGISRCGG